MNIAKKDVLIQKKMLFFLFLLVFLLSPAAQASADQQKEAPQKSAGQSADSLPGIQDALAGAVKVPGNVVSALAPTGIGKFGYDLFLNPPSTFAPGNNIPIGPDYIIGPDDQLKVALWGKVQEQWNLDVDRNGNIDIPKVGVIGVAGLTFKELREVIYRELSKYYIGFDMNITMGKLRSISIYIVGNAKKPGAYTLSSLSTLVNALFAAGGPSEAGSLRDMQLIRNGKIISHFDMYDFLIKGDKTKDAKLMPEDVIFIPPIGVLAGIEGNVKVPAIYELKEETRLLDIINMAGGLDNHAYKGRLQLLRVVNNDYSSVFESDLLEIEGHPEKNITIRDGDVIKIYPVLRIQSTVSVSGAVAHPDEYAIIQETTRVNVKDLLTLSRLLYYASNEAELTRIKATPSGPKTENIIIDISKALHDDPQHNLSLEINDSLFVRSVPEWQLLRNVTIDGEVRFPGSYAIKKGERLASIIKRAGGFTDKAYLKGSVFTRKSIIGVQQANIDMLIKRAELALSMGAYLQTSAALTTAISGQVHIDLREMMDSFKEATPTGRVVLRLSDTGQLEGNGDNIELENGDRLFIQGKKDIVNIYGKVMIPYTIAYSERASYKDYIGGAGGYSRNADIDNAIIIKVNGSAIRADNNAVSPAHIIEPGDTIFVPEKPEGPILLKEITEISNAFLLMQIKGDIEQYKASAPQRKSRDIKDKDIKDKDIKDKDIKDKDIKDKDIKDKTKTLGY